MPIGRRSELARLAELLGNDAPVVVVGEAGVGKTTVLRAAADRTGRDVRQGGALSTLSWLDFLALERAIGRPMIDGDPTAIARDLERAINDSLLLLDDLQWAGTATLDVVTQLAGRVAVIAGVRSGDAGTDRALERLAAAGFATIELGGLPPEESVEFARSLRPDLAGANLARLVERTGGNPLLLRELAATGEPSPSLRRALAARLRGLDTAAAEAFGLMALAGRPVSADALGAAAVKGLLEADLVIVGPHGMEVRHALLAEVAVEQMAPDERRELHAWIGHNVHDAGEAARHYALAGQPELALGKALQALAATSRPGEQASHLAVAASCASGPEADALRLRAAEALEIAHDWDTMLAMLDALDTDDPEIQAKAYLLRARGAYSAGDAEGLRVALTAGIQLVDGNGSDIEVQLKIEQTRIPVLIDYDSDLGLPMARRGLELAEARGVDVARANYLLGTAQAIFAEAGAEDHLGQAIAGARAAGDISTEFLAVSNLISTYEMNGDAAAGQELCTRYIDRAHELGLGEWAHLIRIARASLDFHGGAYERALTEAEDLLAHDSDKRGNGQLVEMYCVALIDVGRIDEALHRLTMAEPSLIEDPRGEFEALWVRTEAALWGGQPAEAMTLAQRYMTFPDQDANRFFGAPTLAWASFDLGLQPLDPPEVQDIPILRAIPVEVDGVGTLCRGDFDSAAGLLADAATIWAPMHRRGELRSLWGAGEATRRGGDVDRAVELLETVEKRAQQHGMQPLLARVHRSLRAAGVRRSAPRTRMADSSLTGRQREVLALVADGLTNAQIATRLGVSRHTVVTQLASASAKLGASSRAQAASLAAATFSS